MIIPKDAVIAEEKIRDYLLKPLPIDDKSGYLALAGYTLEDYWELIRDIRDHLLPKEGKFQRDDEFGAYYLVLGTLRGPNNRELGVRTIWQRTNHGVVRFITLYPDRKGERA
jgi:hypothetical protein